MKIGDTVRYTRAVMKSLTPHIEDLCGEIIAMDSGGKTVRIHWDDDTESSALAKNVELVKAPPPSTWTSAEQKRLEALRSLITMEAWQQGKIKAAQTGG